MIKPIRQWNLLYYLVGGLRKKKNLKTYTEQRDSFAFNKRNETNDLWKNPHHDPRIYIDTSPPSLYFFCHLGGLDRTYLHSPIAVLFSPYLPPRPLSTVMYNGISHFRGNSSSKPRTWALNRNSDFLPGPFPDLLEEESRLHWLQGLTGDPDPWYRQMGTTTLLCLAHPSHTGVAAWVRNNFRAGVRPSYSPEERPSAFSLLVSARSSFLQAFRPLFWSALGWA